MKHIFLNNGSKTYVDDQDFIEQVKKDTSSQHSWNDVEIETYKLLNELSHVEGRFELMGIGSDSALRTFICQKLAEIQLKLTK